MDPELESILRKFTGEGIKVETEEEGSVCEACKHGPLTKCTKFEGDDKTSNISWCGHFKI